MRAEENITVEFTGGFGMKRFLALSILVLSLMGCSSDSVFQGMADTSNRDATIADASVALDEKNYDKVISDLASLYDTTNPDPEVGRLLGSAYMGKAGIDVTNLIDFGGESDTVPFNMAFGSLSLAVETVTEDTFTDDTACDVDSLVVLMQTDGGQYIDGHCMGSMITYLQQAQRIFEILYNYNRNSDDDIIQWGIASAVHFCYILGNGTADALNPSLQTSNPSVGSVPVPIMKTSYKLYRNDEPWGKNYRQYWARVGTHATYTTSLTIYQNDLISVNNAINTFATPNYISADLDNYLRDILMMQTGDIDNSLIYSMTTSDLTNYINNVLSVE